MDSEGWHSLVLTRDQLRDILTAVNVSTDGLIRFKLRDDYKVGPRGQEISAQVVINGRVYETRAILEDVRSLNFGENWAAHRLDRNFRDMRNKVLDEFASSAPAAHDPVRDRV